MTKIDMKPISAEISQMGLIITNPKELMKALKAGARAISFLMYLGECIVETDEEFKRDPLEELKGYTKYNEESLKKDKKLIKNFLL